MGDRAIIQMKNGDAVSPALYTHWSGSDVKSIIEATKEQMKSRHDDMDYAFARLVQNAVAVDKGSTGFGVFNQAEVITQKDSHGDAGCFLIDVSRPEWPVSTFGGYGFGEEEAEENDD